MRLWLYCLMIRGRTVIVTRSHFVGDFLRILCSQTSLLFHFIGVTRMILLNGQVLKVFHDSILRVLLLPADIFVHNFYYYKLRILYHIYALMDLDSIFKV